MRRFALLALVAACAKPYLPLRPEAGTDPPALEPGLFVRSWRPAGAPRGVLVIMHGLRDHSGRYAPVAAALVARGYAVHAFDLRGHGRSAGRRVTVDRFQDYVDDLDRFIARVQAAEPGAPLFVFGHSMGGAIAALWAIDHGERAAGLILSAPALRIAKPPIAAAALRLSGTLTPNFGALAADNHGFSSDPAVTAGMANDPLIYQPAGPAATGAELVGAIERFWAGVDRLRVPLLLLHGSGDILTAPAGSREIYLRAASADKTLRIYDRLYHDLVHEPGHDRLVAEMIAWMDAHTGGPAADLPAPDLERRLDGDGVGPGLAVMMEGGYRRGEDVQGGSFDLRARLQLGSPLAWSPIVEGGVGSLDGLTYRAALYPVALALVRGATLIGVGAGGGLSGPDFDWELPVAVDLAVQLGPVRLLGWGRLVWVRDDEEVHAGAALRLGRNHRYWSTVNAGVGPYLGATVSAIGERRVYGLVLGLDLWGGY